MLIKDAQYNEEDGWEFNLQVTNEETSFLVNYAILDLIKNGVLKVASEEGIQEFDLNEIETVGGMN